MKYTKVFFAHRGLRHGSKQLIDWESHLITDFSPAADLYFALANWLLDAKPALQAGDIIAIECEQPLRG